MKVIAYTALLYGVEYLEYAIRSVINHVDEYHVIYSPIGAHGTQTDYPCPESRDELLAAAQRGAGEKLHWHDSGPFPNEGAQRDTIFQLSPDADVILVIDSDEIWSPGLAEACIKAGSSMTVQRWKPNIIHYWRSLHYCVLHDPAFPDRVIVPHAPSGTQYLGTPMIDGKPQWVINHCGYAQKPDIVWWKQLVHGHRGQWRTDFDWFGNRFMTNSHQDCHPVGSPYWNPERVDPADYMPEFMKQHPYWLMEVIE